MDQLLLRRHPADHRHPGAPAARRQLPRPRSLHLRPAAGAGPATSPPALRRPGHWGAGTASPGGQTPRSTCAPLYYGLAQHRRGLRPAQPAVHAPRRPGGARHGRPAADRLPTTTTRAMSPSASCWPSSPESCSTIPAVARGGPRRDLLHQRHDRRSPRACVLSHRAKRLRTSALCADPIGLIMTHVPPVPLGRLVLLAHRLVRRATSSPWSMAATPQRILETIDRRQVSSFYAIPAIWRRIFEADRSAYGLSSLTRRQHRHLGHVDRAPHRDR